MRVGSLFSGIGGIELGLERARGFTTAWFVENEPHAQAVLRQHWPTATIYDDVTTIDWNSVPPVDILTGGFPCQDISNAGKRAGITGSRSSLWKCYLEAIRILRPRFIIAENVSALLGRGLNVVLEDLAALGYDAEWHCISASSVGAPHRRDRIFILAYPNSGGCVHGQAPEQSDKGRQYALGNSGEGGSDVANADSQGLQRRKETRNAGCEGTIAKQQPSRQSNSDENVSDTDSRRLEGTSQEGRDRRDAEWCSDNGWWAVEPRLGRVAHGVPHRVDRIKRLGNAVVPQVAEAVGRAINEVMRDENC